MGKSSKSMPVLAVAIASLAGGCSGRPTFTYQGEFHDAVAKADRVVVRDGGFDFDGATDHSAVLFEVTDSGEIAALCENLQFKSKQKRSTCYCAGYPRVDWYGGREQLAITSIQHGRAVRWEGFQGDADLTQESGAWLVEWLVEHGVERDKLMLE
jgi:hypothetical protein